VEHHFHFGIEHILFFGIAAMIVRYFWKLVAAQLASGSGAISQIGLAMGGLAQ
jgi:hypothetical protein